MNKTLSVWISYTAAFLGLASLFGVLCFYFPELLTSKDFRQVYSEAFARHLLLFGIVAGFVFGTGAVFWGQHKKTALWGLGGSVLAVLLGGSGVEFQPIRPTPYRKDAGLLRKNQKYKL